MGYFYVDGERLRWILIAMAISVIVFIIAIGWLVAYWRKRRKG